MYNTRKRNIYSADQIEQMSHLGEVHIFDTETSGGKNIENRIIQFSATIMNPSESLNIDLYKKELRDVMINPECPIGYYATKVHGFKEKDVEDKLVFSDVIDFIIKRIPHNSIMLAHNVECDMRLLYLECLRLDDKHLDWFYSLKTIDSAKVAREIYPEESKYGLDALTKKLNVKIPMHMRHNAMGDVIGLSECWQKMVTQIKSGERSPSSHLIPVPSMESINHVSIKNDFLGILPKSQNSMFSP